MSKLEPLGSEQNRCIFRLGRGSRIPHRIISIFSLSFKQILDPKSYAENKRPQIRAAGKSTRFNYPRRPAPRSRRF